MEVKWTDDQLRVIQARDCNVLVSAAAGSGKTAVLVERIIERITDRNNPIDIDRMLIVTFTNAAAAEMRERITEALESKKEANPEDELLDRQLTLVHNAMITTIDSFCLFVVRNHFEEINLDPNFRIADQGELELLAEEILGEVFEALYEEGQSSFLRLVDAYTRRGKDTAVCEMVADIVKKAASASWPAEWIDGLKEGYHCSDYSQFLNSELISNIKTEFFITLEETRSITRMNRDNAKASVGCEKLVSVLDEDLLLLEAFKDDMDISEIASTLNGLKFKNFPRLPETAGYAEKAKILRSAALEPMKKNKLSKLQMEKVYEQVKRLKDYVDELVRVSLLYLEAMEKAKKERKILDFADIEHFALQILVDQASKQPTKVAELFREHFDEIMIDEYQDSNQVQEDILTSISGMSKGRYNMFMVGDVKQSIYRFRMAKPTLFMEKYNRFSPEEGSNEHRIDLSMNFRSRSEVLDFTNDIFYKIMGADMGGVCYDDAAALYLGNTNYPANSVMTPEIILYDKQDEEDADLDVLDATNAQIEAEIIKNRILELMKTLMVTDKKTKEQRPVRYSDIVILLRGLGGLGETLNQTLLNAGIPAHMQSRSGYFSAYEIQVLMDMLLILDNPYQDIPMASVLKSPIVGINDEDLAELGMGKDGFAAAVLEAMQDESHMLYEFGQLYAELRKRASDTSIYSLLQLILDKTGFLNYCTCMPAGEQRAANITMLLEKAVAYEQTSYKGLFHFVKYIQRIRKYDLDGEADIVSEGTDSVRIMTIHKSKGLEFPVVFVSGIHKKFMERDTTTKLILHEKYGMGLVEMQANPRIEQGCLLHDEISDILKKENRGEELRILYVALTRAKEKLILTGVVNKRDELMKNATGNVRDKETISYGQRAEATSYLKWLIPAVLSYETTEKRKNITWIGASDLVLEWAEDFAEADNSYEEVMEELDMDDNPLEDELTQHFAYVYPYTEETGKKSKYSVSELKHHSMVANYDKEQGTEIPDFAKNAKDSYVPDFMRGEGASSEASVNPGALRGTAVHRFLEGLNFKRMLEVSDLGAFVKEELDRELSTGFITSEMYELIIPSKIEKFLSTEAAIRMAGADKRGDLYREKPFVMKHEDGFLVQGIIDVFWLEDDHIVLLDYKTDRVKEAEELILRYKTQLDLYQDALQRIFTSETKAVKGEDKLIYSFALDEVINV